jgi:hypothetical protein
MDQPQAKQRRIGISIVAVLIVVVLFWSFVVPRSSIYQTYKLEAPTKHKMRELRPPTGVETLVVNSGHVGDLVHVTAVYQTDLEFAAIKSHYMKEMPLHGFTFVKEEITPQQTSELFCAASYRVAVVCSSQAFPPHFPMTYTVFLNNRNDLKC